MTCKSLCESGKFSAVVALGAVIFVVKLRILILLRMIVARFSSGEYANFCSCYFGVLTTDTIEQAEVRSGAKGAIKGLRLRLTAIEMIDVMEKLSIL